MFKQCRCILENISTEELEKELRDRSRKEEIVEAIRIINGNPEKINTVAKGLDQDGHYIQFYLKGE